MSHFRSIEAFPADAVTPIETKVTMKIIASWRSTRIMSDVY